MYENVYTETNEVKAEQVQMITLPNRTTQTIANLVVASAVIWLVISIFQILVGLVLLVFGVGIVTLGCGCWNIYACIRNFKHANYVRTCSDPYQGVLIVKAYEDSWGSILLCLLINLFLGGGIGVVGAIYDFILRGYVLKHKSELGA